MCHCGTNIAGTVDVKAVADYVATLNGVVVSREYKYMCSDPGQELIQQDIREQKLNRIVVASCSPLLHEHTFRHATEQGGLNPFFFQMVNIRENVSWVHTDQAAATQKGQGSHPGCVRRVVSHKALEPKKVPINAAVLVVGGGIAGIHAALTLANAGKKVYLVEREPTIGGHMAMFDKTFPTLDCAACILTPKMSAVKSHPNITLWTYSEVANVEGYVGNYKIKVKRKPRYIKEDLCVGCMECVTACIYKDARFPDEFNEGLSKRKPVYIPFPQATPQVVLFDPETCLQLKTGKVQADVHRGLRSGVHRLHADRGVQGHRGRDHHPGYRVPALRSGQDAVLRLRNLPERLHRAGGGTARQRLRPHRRRGRPAGRQPSQGGGDHPLRGLA